MQLPEKDYLTFNELADRWKCSIHDLFHYVATRKLIPSIFITGKFQQYIVEPYQDNELSISSVSNLDILVEEFVNGIYYLNWMGNSGRRVCVFNYFSKNRVLSEFDFVFGLDQAVSVTILDNEIVFIPDEIIVTKEEIALFERDHMLSATSKTKINFSNQIQELNGKSKNTALQLIGGLVISTYRIDIHANRLSRVSEIVGDLNRAGIVITEETVSKWIKDAAKVIEKPKP